VVPAIDSTLTILQAADEDGSGELDIDEFCAKLGPHLGVNLKRQQVAQLFMKIDADAGGTVDWCAPQLCSNIALVGCSSCVNVVQCAKQVAVASHVQQPSALV
jgi:uncharacterized metal-binding protein